MGWKKEPNIAELTPTAVIVALERDLLLSSLSRPVGSVRGIPSPAAVPAKGRYSGQDMQRFARRGPATCHLVCTGIVRRSCRRHSTCGVRVVAHPRECVRKGEVRRDRIAASHPPVAVGVVRHHHEARLVPRYRLVQSAALAHAARRRGGWQRL